ncbi:hypothetical protein [Vibrio sp. 10N.239.312.D08]|uniref:hypothetical protein n=1 Tax=Vibrio sp. 10N.239.312.D08 TaxID=3229978 RepID=UPI003551B503
MPEMLSLFVFIITVVTLFFAYLTYRNIRNVKRSKSINQIKFDNNLKAEKIEEYSAMSSLGTLDSHFVKNQHEPKEMTVSKTTNQFKPSNDLQQLVF